MTANLKHYRFGRTEAHAHNKGLAKAGEQWLTEVLCFYFTLVLGNSDVLLNPPLYKAAKRYLPL